MTAIEIKKESVVHRTLSGFFWMFIGTGGYAFSQSLVLIFLARLLTPEDFGLVGAALVVVGFSKIFSQLGIGPAIVQRPTLDRSHLRTGFTISVFFGVFLTLLISLIAPAIATFFRMDKLTPVLRVISLVFLLQGVSVVAESLLQRELRFRQLAVVQVVSHAVGYGVVGMSLAFMDFGVWALVWAHLGQAILRLAILLIIQSHPKWPQIDRRAFRELMYFGGGFTFARIGNYIAVQGDNLVVGRWLGAEALGLYGRAYHLMVMPATLFGEIFNKVLFPTMAKVQDQVEKLETAYRRGIALIALLVLPTSTILIILAPEVIKVLLGSQWGEVVAPLQILALGMLFRTSYKMGDSLARATGAVYRRAWRQAIYAALVLGGAWIGRHWGISGVAVGVLIALSVNFILMAQLSLTLTAMTWRSYIVAHLPAVGLAAVVLPEMWLATLVMREYFIPSLAILGISVLLAASTAAALFYLFPKLFLGRDGIWLCQTLADYLPERIKPVQWLEQRV